MRTLGWRRAFCQVGASIPAIAQAWPMLERLDPTLVVDRTAVLDDIADLVRGLLPR
jgi:hypothetical protein